MGINTTAGMPVPGMGVIAVNMRSIHEACGQYLADLLTATCIVDASGAPFQAVLVRQGLLQQDPTQERISILVNPNDPDDTSSKPEWTDTLATSEVTGFDIPSYEVGGGSFWARRFTIDINVYLTQTQEDRQTARAIATTVFGLACKALDGIQACYIEDDFGEIAFMCLYKAITPYEGGGPPNSFIWRGKIRAQFITEKP
jgi:hypothetical protein